MNRRVFAGGLAASSLLLSTKAAAQESSPEASPGASLASGATGAYLLSSQPGFVRAVVRIFQVTEEGAATILEGGPVMLRTSGAEFETPGHATNALAYLKTAMADSLAAEDSGAAGIESEEIGVGDPGEERFGQEIDVTFAEGSPFQALAFGFLVVRSDRFLQLMLAGGLEPGWDAIEQAANAVRDRWPSADLWQMVPTAEDVPAGLAVASEREVLPGE